MRVRRLYIARHGDADPFGEITTTGRAQARLLGDRLAHLPIEADWHSPLPRAAASARLLSAQLTGHVPAAEAPELIDHVPYVPPLDELPAPYVPFFDGFDADEAAAGQRVAQSLIARFTSPPTSLDDVHEVLITHA